MPRSAAMKMTGHKTEAVYRRYAIVDPAMLQEAANKLASLHAAEASDGENSQSSAKVSALTASTKAVALQKRRISNSFMHRARVAEWQTRRT